MSDYISREAAKAAIRERFKAIEERTEINAILNALPAADVQELKTGRWIMRGGKWRCSECDQKSLLRLSDATGGCREYEYYRANYCPNCGADMREVDDAR